MARGVGAQPGAARPPQTGVAPAPTGSFDDGRPNQIRLSIRARQTILSIAAATSRESGEPPAGDRPTRRPSTPLKTWTGTR